MLILEKERNHSFYQVKITSYENEILSLVRKISASDIKIASIEKKYSASKSTVVAGSIGKIRMSCI